MRTKIIFLFSLMIPFVLVFIYIFNTATDYVYHDDTFLIKGGFIESYLNGNITFADLWRPVGKIRFLGYNLLLLANIKWFSLNSKIFVFLIPFLLLISALLIYREYSKSLTPDCSMEFIAATFLFLNLIIFNIIQYYSLMFGYGLNFQIPMPFIIASFISLELFVTKNWKYLPSAFLMSALAVLVFGGTAIFAFAPALGSTFLCYILIHRTQLTKDFWNRALIMSIFLAFTAFLYLFNINYNDYLPNFKTFFLSEIISHPTEAVRFLLTAFGASVIGIDAFFTYNLFSFDSIAFIGLVILLFYILAIILFFKSFMYRRTYLPFFLIMQTFFHLCFVSLGRFGLGSTYYAMMSSYTCVSIFGLVALAWIFIFTLTRRKEPKMLMKSIILVGITMLVAGFLITSVAVWRSQPLRKAYFEKLRDIALRIDSATPEELERSDFNKQICDSMRLLKAHKLNIYRSVSNNKK